MRTFKDTGITFRLINLGEADRIVSILTKYHGRVDAVAKGIRKTTSRKAGNLDLMTLSHFSFAKGKNLDIITEVELFDSYSQLKKDLPSTFILFYLCELLNNFFKLGEGDKYIFDLLLDSLQLLSTNSSKMYLRAFELQLMTTQGFRPNLKTCLKCNTALKLNEERYLSPHELGFYCGCSMTCKDSKREAFRTAENTAEVPINDKILKVLNFLLTNPIYKSAQIKADKKLEDEIAYITQKWLKMIFERDIKSVKYLK